MVALLLALFLQDPPGPHFQKTDDVRPFGRDQRLVAAYTFTWYDVDTNAHLVDSDGTDALQDHPPSMKDFSYRKAARHRRDLEEMAKAGIDLVLPYYQGDTASLKALAEAIESLDRAPRVGAFLDVSAHKDLFAAARDFFSLIPPKHWALIDGRPVVWLSPTEKPEALDALRDGFSKAIGRAPYIVAEVSWKDVTADARYAWGAALSGPRELDVVSVAPGYNDTTVPGRKATVRDRDGGRGYERAWYMALRIQPRIVAIETWNNFHEATEVCESKEHGRAYLEITAKSADKLHRGEGMMLPKGRWTGANRVLWNLKLPPLERGLRPVEVEDGLFEKVDLAGIDVLTTKANKKGTVRHLYFEVDDSWWLWEKRAMEVTVEYFDKGKGSFTIEYDSADKTLSMPARAYKAGGEEFFSDSGDWKTAHFELADAFFANRQNGGADFRVVIDGRGLMIRRVIVRPK